jgi:hypothetical protein
MYFPLSISDIGLLLAIIAVILILTSEILLGSPKYSVYFKIEKKRLRWFALGCGVAFLITVALRVVQPI